MRQKPLPYEDSKDERLGNIANRLTTGAELTINRSEGTAIINKWTGKDIQHIPMDWAESLVMMGFIDQDSGNFETGDRHFRLNSVFVNKLRTKKKRFF